jgi:hypothetical protein
LCLLIVVVPLPAEDYGSSEHRGHGFYLERG